MSDSQQALLRSAWLDAKDGSLSGREQAKAWAMREIWKGDGKPKHGMQIYIAWKLKKKGGGSPSSPALHQWPFRHHGVLVHLHLMSTRSGRQL